MTTTLKVKILKSSGIVQLRLNLGLNYSAGELLNDLDIYVSLYRLKFGS